MAVIQWSDHKPTQVWGKILFRPILVGPSNSQARLHYFQMSKHLGWRLPVGLSSHSVSITSGQYMYITAGRLWGAFHKVRHARGEGGGLKRCDSLWQRQGVKGHVMPHFWNFLSYIGNIKLKMMFNFLLWRIYSARRCH